jgi:RND family efflux transporter MFP subunit
MKVKKIIIVRIILFFCLIIFFIIGGRKLILRKEAALARSPKFELNARPVETVIAVTGNLEEKHDYLAVIEPLQSADLSARVTAVVEKVLHEEGDLVKTGAPIVILDNRQIRDSIAVIKAQVEQAKAELAANMVSLESQRKTSVYWKNEMMRDADLSLKGTISRSQADASAEKYNEAEGKERNSDQRSLIIKQQIVALERKIDELNTTLSYYSLKSPFDGVVSAKFVDTGDLAAPGKVLFTVEDRSIVKLAFDVPQTDLPSVKEGAALNFCFGDKTYNTVITRIYPKLNRARMLRAEALLPEAPELRLGVYVSASVIFSSYKNVTLIPIGAIVEQGTDTRVFVVENGVLHIRPVKILGTACETAAVEGIKSSERVVINSFFGWAGLAENMKVEEK